MGKLIDILFANRMELNRCNDIIRTYKYIVNMSLTESGGRTLCKTSSHNECSKKISYHFKFCPLL